MDGDIIRVEVELRRTAVTAVVILSNLCGARAATLGTFQSFDMLRHAVLKSSRETQAKDGPWLLCNRGYTKRVRIWRTHLVHTVDRSEDVGLDEGSELFHRVTYLLHLTQPVTLGVSIAEVEERDTAQALLT